MTDHIQALLYRYECVVIPGWGAFLTQRRSARIHQTTHAFYPPEKILSFNRQLRENDGLLAKHIAKAEGISYGQSLEKIKDFVKDIAESLQDHGQVNLEKIGFFYIKDGQALFQPYLHTNYLLEAFGTASFTLDVVEREEAIAETHEDLEPADGVTPIMAIDEAGQEQEVEEDEKGRRPVYWRYAAVAVLAIGMTGFLTAQWYSSNVKSHNSLARQKANREIEQKIQKATFIVDTPLPEVSFKITTKRGQYHIVAGAFRVQANAEKKLHMLKKNGFRHAARIGKNRYGLHQVVYNSFENRREALKALRKIRRSDNPNAWLLVEKL